MTEAAAKVVVSVVVPTRNRDALLRAALASVEENRGPGHDLDVIVVDNGSGPEACEIAALSGARYERSPRPGASAARNLGIQLASGKYIAFLDDDDAWVAGHLTQLVDWLESHPEFGAVMGQVRNVDHDLAQASPPWPESLPADDVFQSLLTIQPQIGATVVRRSVAQRMEPFDEALMSDEDWDWHLRLALHTPVGFVPIPSVLFRTRPTGEDDDLQWMRFPYLRKVYWRNVRRGGSRSPSPSLALILYLRHKGSVHGQMLRSANAHARAGRGSSARRMFGRALRISPLHSAWALIRDAEARQTASLALFLRNREPHFDLPTEAPSEQGRRQYRLKEDNP